MVHRILWQKPRLHGDPAQHRKVTWLELFFDLVFMVVISELVHLLTIDPSVDRLANYLFLFIPAWWIWIGVTYYNDRFETDGLENRVFTFLLMIPVSGLAIFGHHMPGDFSLGYGLCYMAARLLIVVLWTRAAVHEKRFRPVGRILIAGYAVSILIFISSLWVDAPLRFGLWAIALGCDLFTPLLTLQKQRSLPSFSLSKLPERLGLFVLIVIGETLVGVIRGVARHHHFSLRVVSEGIMGTAISFAIWWIYFDDIARRPPREQHKTVFLWSYLHLVLVMAVGAAGAALLNVLTSKHHIPGDTIRYLLAGSLSVSLLFMGLIEMLLKKEEGDRSSLKASVGCKFLAAALILAVGHFGHLLHAFALLSMIFVALLIPMAYEVYVWLRTRALLSLQNKSEAGADHAEG